MAGNNLLEAVEVVGCVAGKDAYGRDAVDGFGFGGADMTACLGEDDAGSGIVPGREDVLEVEFTATHGKVAELGSCGTEATEVVDLGEGIGNDVSADLCVLLVIDREGGAEQRVMERTVADVDGMPVAEGASTTCGMEELARARQIDDTEDEVACPAQPYTDGALVDATGIVAGAVDGIDDPGVFVLGVADVVLLAEEAGAGEQLGKVLHEVLLYGYVAGGDDVSHVSLLANDEIVRQHQRGCLTDDIYYLLN